MTLLLGKSAFSYGVVVVLGKEPGLTTYIILCLYELFFSMRNRSLRINFEQRIRSFFV